MTAQPCRGDPCVRLPRAIPAKLVLVKTGSGNPERFPRLRSVMAAEPADQDG